MFETDPSIGLAGTAQRNQYAANRNARQANIYLRNAEEWQAHAERLERENAQLHKVIGEWKLAHDLKKASSEASDVAAAEWRRLHPDSPMNAAVGTRKDGSPLRRSTSIWIEAFDRIARGLGIANPAAHRIS